VPPTTSVAITGIPKLIASIIETGNPSEELQLMKVNRSCSIKIKYLFCAHLPLKSHLMFSGKV